LREDAEDSWYLLIAVSWIEENKAESLKYIAQKAQQELSPD